MRVAAIILAAGASRRLGRPKQLVVCGEETLLARAIRLAHGSDARPVLVVLGAYADIIRATIEDHRALIVNNQAWAEGIASSIRAGITALDAQAQGALILGCDQPRLSASHISGLLQTFMANRGEAIVISTYAGVRGMPAVFPRSMFAALQALQGDIGARSLLANPPLPVAEVEFEGGEIDIDLPGDLAELE